MSSDHAHPPLSAAIEDAGGIRAVARFLGCNHSQVLNMKRKGNAPAWAAMRMVEAWGVDFATVAPALVAAAHRAGVKVERYAQILADSGAIVSRWEVRADG